MVRGLNELADRVREIKESASDDKPHDFHGLLRVVEDLIRLHLGLYGSQVKDDR